MSVFFLSLQHSIISICWRKYQEIGCTSFRNFCGRFFAGNFESALEAGILLLLRLHSLKPTWPSGHCRWDIHQLSYRKTYCKHTYTFAILHVCYMSVWGGFQSSPSEANRPRLRDWIGGCGTLHDDDHQPHHCLLLVAWVKGQTPKIRGFLRWNQKTGDKFRTLTVWNEKTGTSKKRSHGAVSFTAISRFGFY